MDFDAFDDEILNLSPLGDIDLWPSSPPAATATQLVDEQQSDSSFDEGSADDDGHHDNAFLGELRDDCSEGSFGDGEHVFVASDQFSWKIDHAKGDHKLKGRRIYGFAGGS
jgi:hypothetical protein